MHCIELIQDKNTTNNLPSRFEGYSDPNPHLLFEHDHQIILDKLKQQKTLTMMNLWRIKITTI